MAWRTRDYSARTRRKILISTGGDRVRSASRACSPRCPTSPASPRRRSTSRRATRSRSSSSGAARARASCTARDTFLFNDAGKIVRQTVCILNPGAPGQGAALHGAAGRPGPGVRRDVHFAALGAQDVDKILLDYTEKSVIKVYNQVTDELVEFKGSRPSRVLHWPVQRPSDLSGLAAPAIRVEEATEDKAGMVFLVALPELGVQPRDLAAVPLRRRGQDREAERRHHEAGGRGGRAPPSAPRRHIAEHADVKPRLSLRLLVGEGTGLRRAFSM